MLRFSGSRLLPPVSLLERLRQPAGAAAWPYFVQLYSPLLRHWAQRCGLDEADANDRTQEVFLVLLDKLPTFSVQPGQRFRGWLWTIAANKGRDLLRRRAAQLHAVPFPAGQLGRRGRTAVGRSARNGPRSRT